MLTLLKFFLIFLIFLIGHFFAFSENLFSDPLIQEIATLHDHAINGTREEVQHLEDRINAELAKNPTNQLLRVYLGSLLTIKSSKSVPGIKKWKYFTSGLKLMDTAVEADRENPAVRFVRAMNNNQLPIFFNRRDNARSDFKYLFQQLKNDSNLITQFNPLVKQAICYYAGLAYLKTKTPLEAKEAWQKGLAFDSQTLLGEKIKQALNKLQKKKWQLTRS